MTILVSLKDSFLPHPEKIIKIKKHKNIFLALVINKKPHPSVIQKDVGKISKSAL